MTLEAVWFKNGKEIYWVDPVLEVEDSGNTGATNEIMVFNGYYWYSAADFDEEPDDFIIRAKKYS